MDILGIDLSSITEALCPDLALGMLSAALCITLVKNGDKTTK